MLLSNGLTYLLYVANPLSFTEIWLHLFSLGFALVTITGISRLRIQAQVSLRTPVNKSTTPLVLPVHPAMSSRHSRPVCCHVWPLG